MGEGRFSYRFVKKLIYFFLRLYCRVEYVGRENVPTSGPLIIAANHSSYFDPFFISVGMDRFVRYMTFERFFRMPVIRWGLRTFGAFPVYQQGVDKAAIEKALDILRAGGTFGIFPEGALSTDGSLRPPKLGMAMIATSTGASVLPVTISGAFSVFPKGTRFPRPRKVRVIYHPPILTEQIQEKGYMRSLSHQVMEQIREGHAPDLRAGR